VRYYLGHQSDVTVQVEQRQELERQASFIAKIADNVPGVIYQFLLRPDGSVAFPYASPGLHRAFGVDPADIIATTAGCGVGLAF